jgi:hypothetical protein
MKRSNEIKCKEKHHFTETEHKLSIFGSNLERNKNKQSKDELLKLCNCQTDFFACPNNVEGKVDIKWNKEISVTD